MINKRDKAMIIEAFTEFIKINHSPEEALKLAFSVVDLSQIAQEDKYKSLTRRDRNTIEWALGDLLENLEFMSDKKIELAIDYLNHCSQQQIDIYFSELYDKMEEE